VLWWGWLTWSGDIDRATNVLLSTLPALVSVPAFRLGRRRGEMSRSAILGVGLLAFVALLSGLAATAMFVNHFGWDESWYGLGTE
jgi:hypothetical protein